MRKKSAMIVGICLCLFFGCSTVQRAAVASAPKVIENITFGKGQETTLRLDLALPNQGKGPFPGLIYMYGGGWGYYGGSRSQCLSAIESAANRGYVAATIDYRLTPKYEFPAPLYDAKAAIRWMRANAKQYRIDPNHIGVVGWSSGAHLALLAGVVSEADGLEGESGNAGYSSSVEAVVSMGGMVEAVSFYKQTNVPARVALLMGGTPDEVPDQYRRASPITYLSSGDPPTLLMQGDADTSCPPSQAEMFVQRAKEVGVPVSLVVKKGIGHVSFYEDEAVWAFLHKWLGSKYQ